MQEALPLRQRAYAIARDRLGTAHDNTGIFAFHVMEVLARLDRAASAEAFYREAFEILTRAFPEGHSLVARPMVGLGELLLRQGRRAEVEAILRGALEVYRSAGAAESEISRVQALLGTAGG